MSENSVDKEKKQNAERSLFSFWRRLHKVWKGERSVSVYTRPSLKANSGAVGNLRFSQEEVRPFVAVRTSNFELGTRVQMGRSIKNPTVAETNLISLCIPLISAYAILYPKVKRTSMCALQCIDISHNALQQVV